MSDTVPEIDGCDPCPYCHGKGHMDDEQADICPVCGGDGFKREWPTEEDQVP